MENASKALLIAGAILLVIAIIAIGMTIYGQAQRVVTDTGSQVDSMAVTAHNNMFTSIENGAKLKGSALRDLKAKVESYNSNLSNPNLEVTITIMDKSSVEVTSIGAIKSNAEYEISDVLYGGEDASNSGVKGALYSFTATEK